MEAIVKNMSDGLLEALNEIIPRGYDYTNLKSKGLEEEAVNFLNAIEKEIDERKGTQREWAFNWKDEDGMPTGFNSVWARTREEAIEAAKAMEKPAQWLEYTVQGGLKAREWYKGMYVNVDTLRAITRDESAALNRLGNMMSM